MASQVQISSYQAGICADAPADAVSHARPAQTPPVIAHSFEFVALPGKAQGIQSEIPTAMRHAFRQTDGFVGSMVLVSQQEARLVTVITLWSGSDRAERCSESEKKLQRWLAPYVDRWLRTRRFASIVTGPDRFAATAQSQSDLPAQTPSNHLQ